MKEITLWRDNAGFWQWRVATPEKVFSGKTMHFVTAASNAFAAWMDMR